jgi:glycosyltransferase involved in cell wall biosynthesis
MPNPLTIFVLHCSDLLTDHLPHGDGLTAHGFITHLASRGHRLHVATQKADLREPVHPNVTLYEIPLRLSGTIFWRLEYAVRVRALLHAVNKQFGVDVVHQLNPVCTGLSLSAIGSGLPLVLGTYVGHWPSAPETAPFANPWARWLLTHTRDAIAGLQQRLADAFILTTPAALERIHDADALRHRIHVLPHGIDTETFSPNWRSGSTEPEMQEPQAPTVLFLANVLRRKGIFTLIDAFQILGRIVPNARLRIAGTGPDLAEAKARAARLECARHIEFLGGQERRNTPDLYRNCSVYCLPSFGEPYATTVLEAMSCGKPVVVTDAGGLPYMVSKQGGLHVPVGDVPALASALTELLVDSKRSAAMGQYNRRFVEATMSWDGVAKQLEHIYETTLSITRGHGLSTEDMAQSDFDLTTLAPCVEKLARRVG